MRKYNIINNSLGWFCFVVALITYLLTLEPTASFWDCPEFISQGYKLEVGHPPGNPIFMLTARFFINFVGGDVTKVAVAVNAMSAVLSAGTILLLFWTITHLAKKLIVRKDEEEVSLVKMIVIMGAGLCGALMYAWSDTFWFSAVEGEVYAFSSFCTALVFWLILKWENRADQPHSDRYLILIAYVIGISIAVHLLNLLCIPAIVLVIYYRKFEKTSAKGSLIALLLSFVIVALILYGLVPGFIEVAQYFELFFVNTIGMSFNVGVLIYTVLVLACFIWTLREFYTQKSLLRMRISFALSILMSGIPFIGNSLIIPVVIMGALIWYLWKARKFHVRILNIIITSIFVIFIGYSSYALLLIRSNANPPMNQNAPDNVFDLGSYLSREQYGDTPLLYGRTMNSRPVYNFTGRTMEDYYDIDKYVAMTTGGKTQYAKIVKKNADEPDSYVDLGEKTDYVWNPELDMVFPRIWSNQHTQYYTEWLKLQGEVVEVNPVEQNGEPIDVSFVTYGDGQPLFPTYSVRPTFGENLKFFFSYQLNHMYWRYFLWNFAGRQNDFQGNGEVSRGNWISGIPFIDNARLGDQSLLPDYLGKDNPGHNVFFMLPLLMGIFGILWQSLRSKSGIEQFWVIFFLFFMTGIAIVIYLNQTPAQPRERDYAYAGSFYAFAIWVGLGVPAIARTVSYLIGKFGKSKEGKKGAAGKAPQYVMAGAVAAAAVGIFVPLQVVSQTWDDHDRSGRYTARDFGMNYLNSLDENAIIFTCGDNDTFPLWYAQEVEGCRTDVKVVNLSYLATPWYADQIQHPTYNARPVKMIATPLDYAYDKLQGVRIDTTNPDTYDAEDVLKELYRNPMKEMFTRHLFIPVDKKAAVAQGRVTPDAAETLDPGLFIDFYPPQGAYLNDLLSLDIITTSIKNGWKRPVYFAVTVPTQYYQVYQPYLKATGMTYEVTPERTSDGYPGVNTDKMYRNVKERFQWGGLDKVKKPGDVYLDETSRRMLSSTRSQIMTLVEGLYFEGYEALGVLDSITTRSEANYLEAYAADRFDKAVEMLTLMETKFPEAAAPYVPQEYVGLSDLYIALGDATGDTKLNDRGKELIKKALKTYAQNVKYYQSLNPWQFGTLQSEDINIYLRYYPYFIQSLFESGGTVEDLLAIPGVTEDMILRMNRDREVLLGGSN